MAGDGAAVGVGVVGRRDVGPRLDGPGQGQVDGARLFGVGERHGRKGGVGGGLSVDQQRGPEAGGPRLPG